MREISILQLSSDEIRSLLNMEDVLSITERIYRLKGQGQIQCPPKMSLSLPGGGVDGQHWINSMPAELKSEGVVGIKWVNVSSKNSKQGLPVTMGVIVLNDASNGRPLAVLDGTWITYMRTGASFAVGAKYLARKNSKTIAVIGAGAQARAALWALTREFSLAEIRLVSRTHTSAEHLAREMSRHIPARFCVYKKPQQAVAGADIVFLATGTRKTLMSWEWAESGQYIAGLTVIADLDPAFVKKADKFLFDDTRCSLERVRAILGKTLPAQAFYPDIGQVAAGKAPGREHDREIIVFTPVGLGAVDVGIALEAYRRAIKAGLGRKLPLFSWPVDFSPEAQNARVLNKAAAKSPAFRN